MKTTERTQGGNFSTVGMGLAPIRFPENPSHGLIARPEPDGGKPHPY